MNLSILKRRRGTNEFRLVPYVGAYPLTLGMNADQVRQAMVDEGRIRPSRDRTDEKILCFADGSVTVTLADSRVVEIGLAPPTDVTFEGRNLFRDANAWKELVERDGDPREVVGFLVLRELGIALTGFHDDDEEQKAVTMFERGRWDSLLAESYP